MKRNAYVKCDSSLRGTLKLGSGERFVFVSGGNILFILFPFLQWFLPISCWRDDDLAEDITKRSSHKRSFIDDVVILGVVLVLVRIPLNYSIRFPFQLPAGIWTVLLTLIAVEIIRYVTRKMRIPRNKKIYRVLFYPKGHGFNQGIRGLILYVVLLFFAFACFPYAVNHIILTLLVVLCGTGGLYMGLVGSMDLRECEVRFVSEE